VVEAPLAYINTPPHQPKMMKREDKDHSSTGRNSGPGAAAYAGNGGGGACSVITSGADRRNLFDVAMSPHQNLANISQLSLNSPGQSAGSPGCPSPQKPDIWTPASPSTAVNVEHHYANPQDGQFQAATVQSWNSAAVFSGQPTAANIFRFSGGGGGQEHQQFQQQGSQLPAFTTMGVAPTGNIADINYQQQGAAATTMIVREADIPTVVENRATGIMDFDLIEVGTAGLGRLHYELFHLWLFRQIIQLFYFII
jgi:hypothetical protein